MTSASANIPASAQSINDVVGAEIAAAELLYAARNQASRALFDSAQSSMPGGNTRSALYFEPFPLYVQSSQGATIVSADGQPYLDALGEFTAGLYGHSEPVVSRAVERVLANGFANGAPGTAEIRLADLMCARFPGVETIRFCNSGTEANLYALTLARIATSRSLIVVFSGAYHGGVFVFADGGHAMNIPFDWSVASYNDTESVEAIFAEHGSSIAAVIIEPVMSNGGCIPARTDFLSLLRKRTAEHGALLIFDEVVTSRMGRGGVQAQSGVIPDLTTFGKYVGAGFSSGAFGGRRDLLALMDPTRPGALPHAGTFNSNLFSMEAGADALEQVFTPERAEVLFRDGEILRDRLSAVLAENAISAQFTGLGSIMNLHFTTKPISRPSDTAGRDKRLLALFHFDMMEQGVFVARRGQINLSLPMGPEEFDRIVDAVAHFAARRKPLFESGHLS